MAKTEIYTLPLENLSNSNETRNPKKLKILSWNLGWAYGIGSEGEGYHPKDANHFRKTVQEIGHQIREINPDIAFLQEIDFDSKRSHFVNMPKIIAPIAGLANVSNALSWNLYYLPFPGKDPRNHWGKINAGSTILSKFPLYQDSVKLLSKPKEQNLLYRSFYIHRYLHTARVDLGDHSISVGNVHLEAYSHSNRLIQAQEVCKDINSRFKGKPMIIGGDFNAPPTWSKSRGPYPGSDDSYLPDESFDYLQSNLTLKNCISENDSEKEHDFFSFPSNQPNRILDYIYYSEHFKASNFQTSNTGPLSDHLPVSADFEFQE